MEDTISQKSEVKSKEEERVLVKEGDIILSNRALFMLLSDLNTVLSVPVSYAIRYKIFNFVRYLSNMCSELTQLQNDIYFEVFGERALPDTKGLVNVEKFPKHLVDQFKSRIDTIAGETRIVEGFCISQEDLNGILGAVSYNPEILFRILNGERNII